jgi:signal transduction histidine kinase/CheY-like chemotaxis protein
MIAGPDGMLTYDPENERFVPTPDGRYFPGEGPHFFFQELEMPDGSRWVNRDNAWGNLEPFPHDFPGEALQAFSDEASQRINAFDTHEGLSAYTLTGGILLHISRAERRAAPELRTRLCRVITSDTGQTLAQDPATSDPGSTLQLPPDTRNLRFEFALNRFSNSELHEFQWFLRGADPSWPHFRKRSSIEYNNLKPGNYTFFVTGRNSTYQKANQIEFHFRILAPWHQTPTAYLLYILSTMTLIGAAVRIKERRLRRHNVSLKTQVEARTQEAVERANELQSKNEALNLALANAERLKHEAQAASVAKGRFLATMSHEIRTPMNGVIGMCEMLEQTDLNSQQASLVHTIKRSGESLLNILNGILDFSKIEAGKMELDNCAFSLRDCAEEVLELLAYDAQRKGIELWLNMDPDLPDSRWGDVTRLRQILINLVGNAIKFTEKGEVCILVESTPEAASLQFRVSDTGIGIPESKQSLLFKAFSQVDNSNLRKFGGTGLGLSISKSLVELMGGNMACESKEGEGSTFSFRIPLPVSDAPAAPPASISAAPGKKRTCCLAASPRSLSILTRLLESFGMEVEGLIAKEPLILPHIHPDLIIVECDQHETCPRQRIPLLRQYLEKQHCPIILVSAGLPGTPPEEGILHVKKPVRRHLLKEAVQHCIERSTSPKHHPKTIVRPAIPPPTPPHPHLLLAEDNRVNQRVAKLLLERLGYTLDLAEDGDEVIAKVQLRHYPIILMDIQMPNCDGIDATRWIRENLTLQKQPMIIAMTAGVTQLDRQLCMQANMDGFVEKPIRLENLQAELQRIEARITQSGSDARPQTSQNPESPDS